MEYYLSDNNQIKHKRAGRTKGIRSEKYNQALQEYFLGNDSISYIAKKYNIDRSGLSKAIKSTKKSTIEILKDSESKNFQSQELREQILTNIEAIQQLTKESLEDLEIETHNLREANQMNLDHIKKVFSILYKVSRMIGFSEIIKQNELSDSKQKDDQKINVRVRIVEPNPKN